MNILFLNEYADPHIVSGAERSMKALSGALSRKIKVYTLSPDLGGQSKDIKFPFPKKIKPGQTLTPLWFNNPIFWIYASLQIKKQIKKNKIDLIHVHGKYILPAAVIAGKITKTSVIITVRDFKFLCPLALCYTNQRRKCSLSYYIFKEIPEYLDRYTKPLTLKPLITARLILAKFWQYVLKWFINQTNQVIAVSPQLKEIYQNSGIKNTIAIYNLPPDKFTSTKKLKLQGRPIILSVGKLSHGKGTDTLLQSMIILKKELPQAALYLAGAKNISLKQQFPENVRYLNTLKHKDIINYYCSADIFMIMSRWPEPLSRAGLEALTAGLPIIASNRGGNQEIVKDNGLLVNPDKPKQIAKAIIKLWQKNQPTLKANSLKLLNSRFNDKQIINKHLKLYQKLL